MPLLAEALTAEVVRTYLAHLVEGDVVRYDWPGLGGWNFVLHRALGGGGVASLRYDPQGKSYAQILMDLPVRVPRAWLHAGGLLGASAMTVRARSGRRRERLPRDERVADIMRAARTMFCEKGYADTSTAQIAAQAGVVEGTLYRYFPTKRDLLIKVVEAFYEDIFADYERQLQGVRGTWNRLRFLIWKHLSVIHGDPAMCRLIVHELRPWPQYRQSSVFRLNQRYTRRTLAVIKEGVARGEFQAKIPLQIVRDMIFGCAEHHTWAYLRGEGQFSPDEAADAITNLIYQGLGRVARRPDASVAVSVVRLEQAVQRLEGLSAPRRRQRSGAA